MSTQRKEIAEYCRIVRATMAPHRKAANNICRAYIRNSGAAKPQDNTILTATTVCAQLCELVNSFVGGKRVILWKQKRV
jgi:hypothetical protein